MSRFRAPSLALLVIAAPGGLLAQNGTNPRPAAESHSAAAHAIPSPRVVAGRRTSEITLDGRLNDPAWSTVEPATGFRQAQPKTGEPSTQRTEIRLLFDEEAIYVGARMFDDQGAAGVRSQLVRRDQDVSNSDLIEVIFDTYHNHIGRTIFSVTPAGSKQDAGQATGPAHDLRADVGPHALQGCRVGDRRQQQRADDRDGDEH